MSVGKYYYILYSVLEYGVVRRQTEKNCLTVQKKYGGLLVEDKIGRRNMSKSVITYQERVSYLKK